MRLYSPPKPLAPRRLARCLGHSGLVPFVIPAALLWAGPSAWHAFASQALGAYAAVIVSFLGGIHWGLAFRDGGAARFLWGVLPSLVAAAALLLPARHALLLLGLMLLLCYGVDRRVYPAHGLQAWLGLRLQLTAVATMSCLFGAARC
ncbi:DUF3429 domain-containing protein [Viridibacterium curvum]|uniref:DUF3429 domain-containing protein n=1 Tax=Viridibacterium curvum TaxID=1101404 RepID=A0ABP9QRI4_9RHOO